MEAKRNGCFSSFCPTGCFTPRVGGLGGLLRIDQVRFELYAWVLLLGDAN